MLTFVDSSTAQTPRYDLADLERGCVVGLVFVRAGEKHLLPICRFEICRYKSLSYQELHSSRAAVRMDVLIRRRSRA